MPLQQTSIRNSMHSYIPIRTDSHAPCSSPSRTQHIANRMKEEEVPKGPDCRSTQQHHPPSPKPFLLLPALPRICLTPTLPPNETLLTKSHGPQLHRSSKISSSIIAGCWYNNSRAVVRLHRHGRQKALPRTSTYLERLEIP